MLQSFKLQLLSVKNAGVVLFVFCINKKEMYLCQTLFLYTNSCVNFQLPLIKGN
jgi:hypothetical protein